MTGPEPRFDFERAYGATYQDRIRAIVPGYNDLARMMLAELAGTMPDQGRLLVVGCGAGEELAVMAPARPGWTFTAVDPAEQMVAIAAERIARLGVAAQVTFHATTVAELPRAPLHDGATMALVMHFVPDDGGKGALLESIAHRLRPGAPLALVDAMGGDGSEARFEAWMRYVRLNGMTDEDYHQYRARVESSCHLIGEARLAELLDLAGFGPPAPFYRGLDFGGWIAARR